MNIEMNPDICTTLSKTEESFIYLQEILNNIYQYFVSRKARDIDSINSEYNDQQWSKILMEEKWKSKSLMQYLIPDGPDRVAKIRGRLCRVTTHSYYKYRYHKLAEELGHWCDDPGIVELGCGWGFNLLTLQSQSVFENFTGCDIAENALTAGKKITDYYGIKNIKFDKLNLIDRNDSNFPIIREKTIFTYHCLEQLTHYTHDVLENILHHRPKRVIHIEPTADALCMLSLSDLANYTYIVARDYQRSLISTLQEMERDGKIKILAVRRLGYAPRPVHDNSLVCWEPA